VLFTVVETNRTMEVQMDLVYLGLSAGLFLLSWGLIVACERLA